MFFLSEALAFLSLFLLVSMHSTKALLGQQLKTALFLSLLIFRVLVFKSFLLPWTWLENVILQHIPSHPTNSWPPAILSSPLGSVHSPAGRLQGRWQAQPAAAVAGPHRLPRGLIGCGKSSEMVAKGCALRELAAARSTGRVVPHRWLSQR